MKAFLRFSDRKVKAFLDKEEIKSGSTYIWNFRKREISGFSYLASEKETERILLGFLEISYQVRD